jgi:hypothetical protein
MRITEAAAKLGMSPRMLRYRESLGLLPRLRADRGGGGGSSSSSSSSRRADFAGRSPAGPPGASRRPAGHRQFTEADVAAVGLALAIERRYGIGPAELAFGLRVLADPRVRADVAELGRRTGRLRPLPARAIDFEKERALRLLAIPAGRPGGSADTLR